jgi:sodium/bile acid cotransporter 7
MSLAASAHRLLGFQPRRRGRYWHQIAAGDLVALVDVALLAGVTAILIFASRQLGFARADEITVVFCGSEKSLASGLPIATLLFAGHVGLVVMLLVPFHQIQLMVCASLAQHYAARGATANGPLPSLAATSAWTCDIIATIPHRRD